MPKVGSFVPLLAPTLIAMLLAVPAHAASKRTFVSAAGNDGNPCTLTLPCRTFQAAYAMTAADGEIDALDPAGFGS